MKELEKVKRISIASTLFILAVLIGVLTFERPRHMYTINAKETLGELTSNNNLISINDINSADMVLIDIRSQHEFERGHLDKAINIFSSDILSDENQKVFNELKNSNKTAVIYGKNPQEANIPFLILYQLGYNNIKLLNAENNFKQNKLITNSVDIEASSANIQAFINKSNQNTNTTEKANNETEPAKKVIPVIKKKKKTAEGGC